MACIGFAKQSTENLYVYFDETGTLKFTPASSRYYVLTALWSYDPFCIIHDLIDCRFEMLREGHDVPQFHANPNPQPVRERVYGRLRRHNCAKAAAIVVEKNKVNPVLYDETRFYPQFMEYVLSFALRGEFRRQYKHAIVVMDRPPNDAIGKAVRSTIHEKYPKHIRKGAIGHFFQHPSMSNSGLQAVDYVGWAIGRKWARGETYWRDKIKHLLDKEELDVCARGTTLYY